MEDNLKSQLLRKTAEILEKNLKVGEAPVGRNFEFVEPNSGRKLEITVSVRLMGIEKGV